MKKLIHVIIVICIVVALHSLIYSSGVISFFDFRFFDLISGLKNSTITPTSSSTVVVEIDEPSLKVLGQWPWPRIILAEILDKILQQRPAAVGFDVFFPEPDRTSPEQVQQFYQKLLGVKVMINGIPPQLSDYDRIFAQALADGPTVLPLFITRKTSAVINSNCLLPTESLLTLPDNLFPAHNRQLICNTRLLQQAARGFGFINASIDNDGIFRRQALIIRYKQHGLPCLGLAMLAQVDPDIKIFPPVHPWSPTTITSANRTMRVNRRGEMLNPLYDRESFKRISAAKLLTAALPNHIFTGKMVLVGASAVGLFDQFITADGSILPGVFAHAALLENIIRGRGYYQPEICRLGALFCSIIFSLLVIYLVVRCYYLLSWVGYVGISLASLIITWEMLRHGVYISLGFFLVPFSVIFFLVSMFFAILHYTERKRFLEDLGEAHSATIDSMTMVAETRDVETGAHIIRTKEYVVTLARALAATGHYKKQLTPHIIDLIYRAAPLHDIGKVGIPDSILRKPGRLTTAEIRTMKTHVSIGRSIIDNAINYYNKTNEFLIIAANITYSHHEKWDGSGYPRGLAGEQIPLEGRLMALADVYDALVSNRCYKAAFPFAEAESMIFQESGRQFDPRVIEAFRGCQESFRRITLEIKEQESFQPGLHSDL